MTASGPVLVLATRNTKKAEEMVALVSPSWEPNPVLGRLQVRTLAEFPDLPEVDEDAHTFAGNARKKAIAAAQGTGCWAVADDSGLAVDALGGAPGVKSARYAGTHGDDDANNRRVLAELAEAPDAKRGAAFVCALALSDPAGTIVAEVQAECRGRLIREERGVGGFGYDPLFLIPEYHRTFAELGPLVKHQLSHRARAFARLRPVLEKLVATGTIA